MSHRTYSLRWFERFGNNIQQISNGIIFAKTNNCCFISPEHKLINSFEINNEYKNSNIIYNKFFNCWDFESCNLWDNYNSIRHEIIKNIIYDKLKFKHLINNKLSSDTLVIHIRSGDIFTQTHKPCHKFVQNPLSFFLKVMEGYNKVYICSEDDKNPVLEHLNKRSNTIIYTNRDIVDDLILLMSSSNVCIGGVGTFGISACMLSQNLKNFYSTDLDPKTFLNYNMIDNKYVNKFITHIDQNRYIQIGYWRNTKEQNQLMIDYKL